ncbi:MAG: ABC transporter permease [Cytophagales bacterium]|nr:ABC transporter permease [Cytophagales bacterium]
MANRGLPNWPFKLLRWYCKADLIDEVEGDLLEAYEDRCRETPQKARRHLYKEILQSLNRRNLGIMENYRQSSVLNSWALLLQYGRVLFRNMARSRTYSTISIISLALGITCSALIFLYLNKEVTYNEVYANADKVYRINHLSQKSGRSYGFAPLGMVPHLLENLGSVENGVRIFKYRRAIPITAVNTQNSFNEPRFGWADPSFFDMFDRPFIHGDASTALDRPNVVVISERISQKYFGDQNPIGETLIFSWEEETALEVVGVFQDFPSNTSFQLDLISNIETCEQTMWRGRRWRDWNNMFVSAYVQVKPGTTALVLEEAQKATSANFTPDDPTAWKTSLQPLTSIHLSEPQDIGEWSSSNDQQSLTMFAVIGLIILCLGAFNFTNMITAQAGQRSKEVGVRKVLGSRKKQIAQQTLFETICFVCFAGMVSLGITYLLLPLLAELTSHQYAIADLLNLKFVSLFVGILLLVAIIAGAYPALYISGIQSLHLMRQGRGGAGGKTVRETIVTAQFTITTILIICTMMVFLQLQYLQNKELGFDHSVIVNMPIHNDEAVIPKINAFRNEVTTHPGIEQVSAASHEMFSDYTYISIFEINGIDEEFKWERYTVEQSYLKTFDLNVLTGRGFDHSISTDSNAFVLNESAVKAIGLRPEAAIGKTITDTGLDITGKIIGVVEDFHYRSLHHEIQPFVMYVNWDRLDYISVRLKSNNFQQNIAQLESGWYQTFGESVPFFYNFLDQQALDLYEREKNNTQLFTIFSFVSILLGALGLFGSALFTTERRFKEIGLRKVLGAGTLRLMYMINHQFIKLIILSFIMAVPVASWLMSQWLAAFAYRIDQPIWVFVITGLLIFLIAVFTVSYLSWKAASSNPVKAIKVE